MSRRRVHPKDKVLEFVTFAMTMDEFDAFNAKVKSEGQKRSPVLRDLVREYLGRGTSLAFQHEQS